MRCRSIVNLIALASLIGMVPGMLFAQFDVLPVANESVPRGLFFGILGQVARPGVYELPAGRQTLNDLIDAAGGLTMSASNNLRIVRSGRNGGQTFFQPRVRFELRAGDVIVSERRRVGLMSGGGSSTIPAGRDARDSTVYVTNPGPNSQSSTPSPARSSEPETADAVQLGVIGLLERPVVIAIPSEQATLQNVLATLHQPREGARQITLLKDGSQLRTVPLTEATQTVLTSGSVLVFDAKSAQPESLPKLPQPVRWQSNETASSQSLITTAEVAKPATVEGMFPRSAPLPRDLAVPADESPSVVDVTEKFQAADATPADASSGENLVPQPETSTEDTATAPPASDSKPASASWSTQVMIVLGSAAAVVGLLAVELLRKKSRKAHAAPSVAAAEAERTTKPATRDSRGAAVAPVAAIAGPTLLDELIGNRLEVVLSTVTLPTGVRIHGRPVERSEEFQLRLDAAQSIPQPHIRQIAAVVEPEAAPEATADVQDIPRRTVAGRGGHQRIDPQGPRGPEDPKLLDRVLAGLNRSQRSASGRASRTISRASRPSSTAGRHPDGGAR